MLRFLEVFANLSFPIPLAIAFVDCVQFELQAIRGTCSMALTIIQLRPPQPTSFELALLTSDRQSTQAHS